MSGHPDLHFKDPQPQLMPFKTKAWNRKWDGPGYFVPASNTWIQEHNGPGIPRDSYHFYNEEDWIKFRNMSQVAEKQIKFIKEIYSFMQHFKAEMASFKTFKKALLKKICCT